MKRLVLSVAVFTLVFAGVQMADAWDGYVSCIEYRGTYYEAQLQAYQNPSDVGGIYWKFG